MILTNTGKKFVYSAVIMMFLSMVLPWESLEEYTYSESMGLSLNVIPAIIFVCAAAIVVLKPLAVLLTRIGTNFIFLLLCLLQAIILYIGMQYYPDTYTIGYLLFPASVVVFMLGAIYSTNRIDGTTGNKFVSITKHH